LRPFPAFSQSALAIGPLEGAESFEGAEHASREGERGREDGTEADEQPVQFLDGLKRRNVVRDLPATIEKE
jgi:hypothetical protein